MASSNIARVLLIELNLFTPNQLRSPYAQSIIQTGLIQKPSGTKINLYSFFESIQTSESEQNSESISIIQLILVSRKLKYFLLTDL